MDRRQFLQCVCSVVVGIAIHDFKSKDESCEDDEVDSFAVADLVFIAIADTVFGF